MAVLINRGRIGSFAFDCVVEEKHDDTAVITEFPLEDGTDGTDGVVQKPFRLSMTGFVTDAPVYDDPTALPVSDKRPRTAFDLLRQIKAAAQTIDVYTSLGRYQNMMIESISVQKTKDAGTSLPVTVSLKQVKFVASSVVAVAVPKLPRNKPTKKEGTATGTEVTKPGDSALLNGARKLASMAGQDSTLSVLLNKGK